ncbi:MAG: methyltransferase domain-containing protein [Clostridia bacterium]|nr:methyltransferase domain-containing protein [Clostridia bacterium]
MIKPTYIDLLARYGIDAAHPGGMPLTIRLLRTLNIDKNTKILDVGCGTGKTSAFIARSYQCSVTAADVNDQMLIKSADRFTRENLCIELRKANAEALPFESGTFDILLSESVTTFTSINKAICEYYRVLKPSGTLAAVEITAKTPLTANDLGNLKLVYGIDRILTRDEWVESFSTSGFEDIKSFMVPAVPTRNITSVNMLRDFAPHLRILNHYRRRLCYRVYICKKQYSFR